jgi:hypothetical protein
MSKHEPDSAARATPYENFLYLLSEIERALERGVIVWPSGAAKEAQRRIARLFIQLDAISTQPALH